MIVGWKDHVALRGEGRLQRSRPTVLESEISNLKLLKPQGLRRFASSAQSFFYQSADFAEATSLLTFNVDR